MHWLSLVVKPGTWIACPYSNQLNAMICLDFLWYKGTLCLVFWMEHIALRPKFQGVAWEVSFPHRDLGNAPILLWSRGALSCLWWIYLGLTVIKLLSRSSSSLDTPQWSRCTPATTCLFSSYIKTEVTFSATIKCKTNIHMWFFGPS